MNTQTSDKLPAVQETGIDIRATNELQIAPSSAMAIQEIQATIIVAKNFPRNFNDVWQRTMEAFQRKSLAEVATYSYPRGGSNITGASVRAARPIAALYGNLRYGTDIIRDDDETRIIRGWCWDIETNIKVSYDDSFKKLIYRKPNPQKKIVGGWIKPDERDLRELTNRRGAILVRNAILNVVPTDLVEDALAQARTTIKKGIKDPQGEKKRLLLELGDLGVTVEEINSYLGHSKWSADDIVEMQGIINSIKDGTVKREEFFTIEVESKPVENGEGKIDMKAVKPGDPETHQGHEPEKPKRGRPAGSPNKPKETPTPEEEPGPEIAEPAQTDLASENEPIMHHQRIHTLVNKISDFVTWDIEKIVIKITTNEETGEYLMSIGEILQADLERVHKNATEWLGQLIDKEAARG